ncbi:MAG: hypothetical protein ACFE96_04390 [Candidatus Hermodarchaeota archaeon]
MRHKYKSHGKHCYLRSFQTSCKKCGADVLYWECTHGSKIFFEYPPYGKLIRHFCRGARGLLHNKKEFSIVVKPPKGLLENPYHSCPVCGKLFKNERSLQDHFKELKKSDLEHFLFTSNKLIFSDKIDERKKKTTKLNAIQYEPKFGRINIKTSKED